ncbi:tigger transposable element-derived protein 4-like [Oscarella lobularis]|uniref:tigger transposable element-derived protein 4-like n=1 Tax=Oscarella lobularis TaxID=121494 RepID=UPI0033141D98
MASRKTTRKELTLKERVAVIEYARKNPKEGTRKLSEVFQCGRTQIQSILKSREKIMESFRANDPLLRKRKRESELSDTVYRWYSLARERDIPVTGPMLQEEALKIGEILGEKDFKASNGWLSNFKKRHNIAICRGRKAKDRLTILLCANAAGDKRSPLVIGRAEKPS